MKSRAISIPLSSGKSTIIDEEDFKWISRLKWSFLKNKWGGYAVRVSKNKMIYLHREIMKNPIENVDHINGDKLDNRRVNLRIVNNFQNARNKSMSKNNTSGYKGVYFHKASGKFQAYIDPNRKRICLGYFDNPKKAAKAYNKAAIKYFGEYSRLNII